MAPASTAAARTQQISAQLVPASNVLATRFRPTLPAGLAVNFTPLNPVAFLLKAASIRPAHPGLEHPETGRSWTFEQWATRVGNLAYALRARGVRTGDKVLVAAPNSALIADALQAIPALGAVIVPINVRQTAKEVEYIIADSGANFLLVDYDSTHLVPASTQLPVVICQDGKAGCPYEAFLEEGAAFDRQNGGLGWAGLEFVADEERTFAICYTSGTTNLPKGVETTYRGTYLAAIANAVEAKLTHSSKYLWILPMFHCLGWCFPYANTMMMSTQVCMRSVGNYDQTLNLMLTGVTHYCGAPTVQISIQHHELAPTLKRHLETSGGSVATCIAGAAPSAALIQGLETIGIEVTHVYGLTETYGPIARTYFPKTFEDKAKLGAAFLTADDIRVVKLHPEGTPLDVNAPLVETRFDGAELGEIVMRGNIVMKGYHGKTEATRETFAGGYFHTGDLAVRHPDGSFQIQDRSKDLVISGGENVSTLAVEAEIYKHPDVLECAVVARADEKWGERPHAFVVVKQAAKWAGRHDEFEKELKAFTRPLLPGFARPHWVEIMVELEKSSTGKISKKLLRDGLKQRK